jgi:hypothetical protein
MVVVVLDAALGWARPNLMPVHFLLVSMCYEYVQRFAFGSFPKQRWTLLPNKQLLTVDAYVPISPFPYIPTGRNSEL